MIAIAAIRLLPIAPFSVVNAVAGASHIRLRDFMIGTAMGMAPGIAATVIFVDRVAAAVTDPSVTTYAAAALLAGALAGIALYFYRRLGAGAGASASNAPDK
jgi:uncharacterized membrane protein YdjX (TVP38/TMEM64 family)